jgi:hypothetical protein
MRRETGTRHREGAPQMTKWNFVAMGQVGLTGRTRAAAQPVARAAARWTGRPEAQILSLIGAGFLAISLIDFLRQVDAVVAAGRTGRQPANDALAERTQGGPAGHRHPAADLAAAGSKGQQPRVTSSRHDKDDKTRTTARRKP